MGASHPDIYVERMEHEYNVECTTGKPRVGFRETIADLIYTHKKQRRVAGQNARVIDLVKPIMTMDLETGGTSSSWTRRRASILYSSSN